MTEAGANEMRAFNARPT